MFLAISHCHVWLPDGILWEMSLFWSKIDVEQRLTVLQPPELLSKGTVNLSVETKTSVATKPLCNEVNIGVWNRGIAGYL
jgi:hypothetical protein